jgi:hypothetical protein
VGLGRANRRTGINANLQYAMWIFGGLKSYGLEIDHKKAVIQDVQFPSQTLAYKTGSPTDAALLYMALLEAGGIHTALIPTPDKDSGDHFVLIFNTGMSEKAAAVQFNGEDRLLVIDNKVWIPVGMSAADSFDDAWTQGVIDLNSLTGDLTPIELSDAWQKFPPAPFPALGHITLPGKADAKQAADTVIDGYIESDLMPLVEACRTAAEEAEAGSPAQAAAYNRLGIAQIRAGKYGDAEESLEKAVSLGSKGATRNLAMLSTLMGNSK